MNQKLHIISFNVPYPPDYGGVIDVYYKIKALKEIGIKVHLHCYEYGRPAAEQLNVLCESVNYYHREHSFRDFSSFKPYIVKTRRAKSLLKNLEEVNAPILFEGLHTCYHLDSPSLEHRNKLVRMHNIEADYYRGLGQSEQNMLRRFYFYTESVKLKFFEKILRKANHILPISSIDFKTLSSRYKQVTFLPAFHPNEVCINKSGRGNFLLYHGNLSVSENIQASAWLISKVFSKVNYQCIIAGANPSPTIKKLVEPHSHIQLIENPTEAKLNELLATAQVNVLPTFQQTGTKLKLLNALFRGRYVLVNKAMVEESGLEGLCIVKEKSEEMVETIHLLMENDFTQEESVRRISILEENFSNKNNAVKLVQLLDSPAE